MNQRKIILVTLLGLALVSRRLIAAADTTTAPAASAASPAPAPDHPHAAWRARFLDRLGLSAEQRKQIEALGAERDAALAALQADASLAPEARRDKARALLADFHGRMLAELTPEQQQQAARMRHGAGEPPPPGWARPEQPSRRPEMGPGPRDPLAIVALGERIKDRIAAKLQLTEEQQDKLEHLGRAFRAQQREAWQKHREEMRAILTPEQQEKVEEWKQRQHPGRGGRPPGPRVGWDDEAGPEARMVADDAPGDEPGEE